MTACLGYGVQHDILDSCGYAPEIILLVLGGGGVLHRSLGCIVWGDTQLDCYLFSIITVGKPLLTCSPFEKQLYPNEFKLELIRPGT